jgi:transposase
MRPPLRLRELTADELAELHDEYRSTKEARIRTRVQIVLLAAEQKLTAPAIAQIVRVNDQTVRNWLRRYESQGLAGLFDEPRPGAPRKVTDAYEQRLLAVVRQRPRALAQPFSMWTIQRLVDFLGEESGIHLSKATVQRLLADNEIVFSRPQHKISSPDPEYEVKKRRLKSNASS